MHRTLFLLFISSVLLLPLTTSADELVSIIQQDLVILGYDPGNTDGEESIKTVVAVSKFQSEHDMEVTGELTPQLAGVIKAAIKNRDNPPGAANAPAVASSSEGAAAEAQDTAQRSEEELKAAQQACLQEKYEAAQESSKKKRGFGRLLRAVSRTASQLGGNELANQIYTTTYVVYGANATAEDLKGAAEDLGLTEDDIEECRNP